MVFLPGTMCDARVFAAQIAHFNAAGWRIRTPVPVGNKKGVPGLAADILARLPARFALTGLSLGGVLAIEMMRQDSARVMQAALLDTNDEGDSGGEFREKDFARAEKIGLEDFFYNEMAPRYLHPDRRQDESLRRTIADMALDGGASLWRAQIDLLPLRHDNREFLRETKIPLLIGCGEADAICPPARHRRMAGRRRLEIFAGAGHLPTLETPQAVTDVLSSFFVKF